MKYPRHNKTKKSKPSTVYKSSGGFTLIELIVTIGIFSLLIGGAVGLFSSAIQAQRKSLVLQKVLDSSSYNLEYMSRALRMAKKEISAPACLSQNGLNYALTRGGKGIKFRNYQDVCQEFFVENNQLKLSKQGEIENLTSDDTEITSFNLNILGASDSDMIQPRVIIALTVKGKGQKLEEQSEIKLQTTISQRNPDLTSGETSPPPPVACEGAPNTAWGANLYDCIGSDTRCYNGSCITCGGWMNLGYCWHNGGNAQSCTTVCSSYGGTYPSDCGWPYDAGCSTCLHFYPGQTCLGGSAAAGPCYGAGQGCFYGSDNPDSNCNAAEWSLYRQCGCNQ